MLCGRQQSTEVTSTRSLRLGYPERGGGTVLAGVTRERFAAVLTWLDSSPFPLSPVFVAKRAMRRRNFELW